MRSLQMDKFNEQRMSTTTKHCKTGKKPAKNYVIADVFRAWLFWKKVFSTPLPFFAHLIPIGRHYSRHASMRQAHISLFLLEKVQSHCVCSGYIFAEN
jgi:hypothetical protein